MELFRATVLKGGKCCEDGAGNKFAIHGITFIRKDGSKVFYDKNDDLFKSICQENTSHEVIELENGTVNICG